MDKHSVNNVPHKSRALTITDNILFAICLSVLALRTTVTEGLGMQAGTQPINIGDNIISLLVSGVLIFSFLVWLICNICSKQLSYRRTFLEIGLLLFIIAAIISSFNASGKRAAITESIVVIAPILSAVLLVQLLNTRLKIKLLLAFIAALGAVQAYQCSDQLFTSNEMTIQQYEESPDNFLGPLGIETGTLQHWLFEHRIYTKAVNGFFTNKNSVGCFLIIAACAAFVLFAEQFKVYKNKQTDAVPIFCCAMVLAFIIWGLLITKSKGAILAALISVACFTCFVFFHDQLKKHRKLIFSIVLILAVLACIFIVNYGRLNGRLPGGNSMLVRWQYWQSTAKMISDYPLTGVGSGNFSYYFTHYKYPGAIESVADPHNFLMSFLAQYGPLGLIAISLMLFIPLKKVLAESGYALSEQIADNEKPFKKFALPYLIITALLLLFVRPFLIPAGSGSVEITILLYILFALYVAPIIVFLIGIWLVSSNIKTTEWFGSTSLIAALFCTVIGVLVQNLIDFAIFEPGIATAFWALMACLIALNTNNKKHPPRIVDVPKYVKAASPLIAFALLVVFLAFAFVPVAAAVVKTKKALATPGFPHQLLEEAADCDKLDSFPLSLNGKLYLEHFRRTENVQPELLQNALNMFLAAIERNPADYKSHERLTETYLILADSDRREKQQYLQKSLEAADRTVELYPGSARIHLLKASIAERLEKNELALEHYSKTVEIEDAFRDQFAIMYPDREIISRLGKEKYNMAKQKIEQLKH
ncbi:MAG: O-antigen ligase family protein [Planctomycetota bacterium]|jgi:O-antigen ligase